jgi:phosphomethylpyrimidine synthase
MTQLQSARKGLITPEMIRVAVRENVTPEFLRDGVARGAIVIPANVRHLAGSAGQAPLNPNCELRRANSKSEATQPPTHGAAETSAPPDHSLFAVRHSQFPSGHPTFTPDSALWVNQTVAQRRAWLDDPDHCRGQRAPRRLDPTGIGRSITTKINANQGASPVSSSTREELDKLRWAILYGADTVMDLSTGGNLIECRQAIIDHSTVPVGTVPIYSMILGRSIEDLTYDDILREIERQARQGVDYFTIHAGVLREHLPLIRGRITGLVSRGGSLLAKWMIHHGKQNPMYELFDEISAIMREYDVTYSLGDGIRPGCLADASDPAQIAELHVLGELVHRARDAGVQVMVEGPGHVPLNEIAWNMEHQRTVCDDAPFYVLGPLVTDVFPGYDHITSAIGACEAARAGAAMLCYVTPKEHVGLPRAEDVKAGCIAYKIAAHAGDIARGIRGARQWDDDLSKARAALNWPKHFELAFDGETARALHDEDLEVDTDFCAMCGHDWCSMRISKEIEDWASGKAEGFGPSRKAMKSPGLTVEQQEFLAQRAVKHACHSDNVPDADEAQRVQREYVKLNMPD